MIRITEEHKQAIKILKSRKEWDLVEDLLKEYLDSIKDITSLTDEEIKTDKNVVFIGRLRAYQTLLGFLRTINLISQTKQGNTQESYE